MKPGDRVKCVEPIELVKDREYTVRKVWGDWVELEERPKEEWRVTRFKPVAPASETK